MRPLVLNPLFASLTSLPGVGPKLEKLYAICSIETRHASSICCSTCRPASSTAARGQNCATSLPGQVVTVAVTVDKHRPSPPHRSRAPYRIYAHDDTGDLTLTFFNARRDYLEKLLPVGETRYVSGTAEFYDGMLQMVHPDRVVDEAGFATLAAGRAGLSADRGSRARQCTTRDGRRADPAARTAGMAGRGLGRARAVSRPSLRHCAACIGRPSRTISLPENPAWTRLAYDELLAGQLALALVRAHMRRQAGRGSRQRRAPARANSEGAALCAHPFAAAGGGRHHHRPRPAAAHAAAAARRRRLRKDGRGADRRSRRHRGRTAGGLHGADRNSGASASRDDRTAGRSRRHPRRHSDRPRTRARPARKSSIVLCSAISTF